MDDPLIKDIEAHLRQMESHQKQRRTGQLLIASLAQIKIMRSQLDDIVRGLDFKAMLPVVADQLVATISVAMDSQEYEKAAISRARLEKVRELIRLYEE